MALLHTEGFDWQAAASDLARLPNVSFAVGTTAGSVTFADGSYGVGRSAALSTGNTSGQLSQSSVITFTISGTSTVYVQADFYVTRAASETGLMAGTIKNLALYEGSTLHLGLTINSLGQILLQRGATLIATSGPVISLNTLYRLDFRAVIGASGSAALLVNGVSAIAFSGNTQNGATGQINQVQFGVQNRAATGVGNGVDYRLDNVVIQDATGSAPYNAPLPPVIVDGTLRPNADVSVQGTPSTGSSNFALVDEVYVDTADYVSFNAGEKDRYDIANLPVNPVSIYAVKALGLAGTGSSGLQARMNMVVGADSIAGSAATIAAAGSTALQSTTRPAGGSWTKSDVDALRVEFERTT